MDIKSTAASDLSEERKLEIITRLQERGAPKACPMCGKGQWSLMGGYFNHPLQTQLDGLVLGKSVPSVIMICLHCGFISQHALGTLGLLPRGKAVNTVPGKEA
jgi:hypothetical protein